MTWLFTDKRFQEHETGEHPETSKRLEVISRALAGSKLLKHSIAGQPAAIALAELRRTHADPQITAARDCSARGGGFLDADTVCSPKSYDVALLAAGTAVAAVDAVMSGKTQNALCLIRPPGHHATPTHSMGFCLFNNVAVAAQHAQFKHGVGRILIVDWDVHHGNGTQDIFYEREDVFYFSIHRYPFYPGTGAADEVGSGKGRGSTLNVPIAFGTARQTYFDLFQDALDKACQRAKPELILISAGFDAHAEDPIGNLGLVSADFAELTKAVMAKAKDHCQGRIVSCLEGGYNLQALQESVIAHLGALETV